MIVENFLITEKINHMIKNPVDKYTPEEKFRTALNHLLSKQGRGALSRLAEAVGRKPAQISHIKEGIRPGDEKLKQKIANYFGMTYEEFLILGATLLEAEEKAKEMSKELLKEPFPGFNEVMELPLKERYIKIEKLAVEHAGIPAELVTFHDERFAADKIPLLETEEQIVEYYKERLQFWQKKADKIRKILEEE